jgi:hypothetical protein
VWCIQLIVLLVKLRQTYPPVRECVSTMVGSGRGVSMAGGSISTVGDPGWSITIAGRSMFIGAYPS